MDLPGQDAEALQRRKRALRAAAGAARRALTVEQRRDAADAAVARLLALPELREVDTVLLYAALADELHVGAAIGELRRRGARVLLPRVRDDTIELAPAGELHALTVGYRGIREPAGPRTDPDVIDVAVLPGVAFDPVGGRLGRGGGHYDRLLPQLPADAARIGVCFACQVVPMVPREPHDAAIDVVVTERAVYRTHARPEGSPA